jgi:hypothetical protein
LFGSKDHLTHLLSICVAIKRYPKAQVHDGIIYRQTMQRAERIADLKSIYPLNRLPQSEHPPMKSLPLCPFIIEILKREGSLDP